MKKSGVVGVAAARAGMHRNTAHKWLSTESLPSETGEPRGWLTREDPFADVWPDVQAMLEDDSLLEAKTIFEQLKAKEPEKFQEGQLRTLQRKVKIWRAESGPEKELFFPQEHVPGEIAQTDFTRMAKLEITLSAASFPHMLCHTTLPYSNWSWGTPCQSESMAALKQGIQENFSRLGRLPKRHQMDNSTAATHHIQESKRPFNKDYLELMEHMGMKPQSIGIGKKEQNGDVEAQNGALKRHLDQQLRVRGSRDFDDEDAYYAWLCRIFEKRNRSRSRRLEEELVVMRRYEVRRLPEFSEHDLRVGESGTIRIKSAVYSLPSRLKGEKVRLRVFDNRVDVYYAQKLQLSLERVHGKGAANINYRHLIGPLLRKSGAFRLYRYRDSLFPSQEFRDAFDSLDAVLPTRQADIEYLRILSLAAETREDEVEQALIQAKTEDMTPLASLIKSLVKPEKLNLPELVEPPVNLGGYDSLLTEQGGLQQ